MKKSIVFFILTIGWLIEGCYEDKGHYDYIRISARGDRYRKILYGI